MKFKLGFSAFLTIKPKTRNPLVNPEHNFRCFVSKISLQLAKLVDEKPAQPSQILRDFALTYKYLLFDKLDFLLCYVYVYFHCFLLFVYFLIAFSFSFLHLHPVVLTF